MKKYISILVIICLLVCGCSQKGNVDDKTLKELKSSIESNTMLIQELTTKNQSLENKIVELEEEKQSLTDEVKKLQESDTTISSNMDSKYNELKTLINNKPSSSGNQYTITKQELLGTWQYVGYDTSITFTNDNVEMIGNNWFLYQGNRTIYYIFKNGKLYIADDGVMLTK